jgi:ABC-type dipeptide/oligopeptide/nickel transport system permease component
VARYLLFRLLDMVPTVFLVLTLVFIAMRILPGDPALAALGPNADGGHSQPSASGWASTTRSGCNT